jgi:triacylglycerol esterase/lipase EstA (alpha/beta hydrolase family)
MTPITLFPVATWESNAKPINTLIRRLDYVSSNTNGYAENFPKLASAIESALGQIRAGATPTLPGRKIAATRADVVGHSMGGLLTKWYVAKVEPGLPLPARCTEQATKGSYWKFVNFEGDGGLLDAAAKEIGMQLG